MMSTNLAFIPGEIIEDILTRLPVKSLSRFKCVSKPWLSLISSPRFIKTHLHISSLSPRVMDFSDNVVKYCPAQSLVLDPVPEVINVECPDTNTDGRVWFIGTCNGLVCFSCDNGDDYYYFIWNPCTKILKKLPPLTVNDDDTDDEMEDETDGEWKGSIDQFGYSEVDDDYKVLFMFMKEERLQVEVYSLRANSWKIRVCINDGITPYSEYRFINGKVYISMGTDIVNYVSWIGKDAYRLDVENIVSWDFENEVYEIIEQPNYGEGDNLLFLEKLEGSLCVVCKKETHADFWVMKEYGVKDSWCKILTVSFCIGFEVYDYPSPLIMLPSGEFLVASEDRFSENHFELCNPKNNNSRVLDTSNFGQIRSPRVYVESLVSPTQFD